MHGDRMDLRSVYIALTASLLLIVGNQATPESYKQWKIRNEPVMISSDRGLEQKSSSPADSSYLNTRIRTDRKAIDWDRSFQFSRKFAV